MGEDRACPETMDLGGYLDGTMNMRSRRRAMESHLAGCSTCRREVVELYSLLRAPMTDAPPDLVEQIMNLHPDGADGELPAGFNP